MTPWHLQRMAALDFESSDKDPLTARIVSCALILVGGDQPTETFEWLLNPGIPMEPEAIKVHGITDEYAAAHGQPAAEGVTQIAAAVSKVAQAGIPLVGHNLGGYDLTLLDAECARHGLGSFEGLCGQPLTRVIDTMVLDRHVAPFRKKVSEKQGSYQMQTTAEMYGLGWDETKAHGAAYDALKSAQAAWRMGCIAAVPAGERPEWVRGLVNRRGPYERFDDLRVDVEELHRRQVRWHATWAADFQAYLRQSDPTAVIDGSWPLRTAGAS
jgi:DNA polymerase-3 subunit epsilon